MATGSLDANGIWQYGEDDSEATFSALLNKLGGSTSTQMATAKPLGRVVQTVAYTVTAQQVITSSSFQDTNLAVTITPRYSSSKILILVAAQCQTSGTASAYATINRGATNLGNATLGMSEVWAASASTASGAFIQYLDSPATTLATTYRLRVRSNNSSNTTMFAPGSSTITVMEITA